MKNILSIIIAFAVTAITVNAQGHNYKSKVPARVATKVIVHALTGGYHCASPVKTVSYGHRYHAKPVYTRYNQASYRGNNYRAHNYRGSNYRTYSNNNHTAYTNRSVVSNRGVRQVDTRRSR